ncbi:MAG: alkaline phosphatase family protein [Caulobacteraceae bacterium]
MATVQNVVVLMLENRSLDSMLGWLYETGAPNLFIPSNVNDPYRGLQAITPSDFANSATTSGGTITADPQLTQTYTAPSVDPGEEFDNVNLQLFDAGTYSPPANMLGYLQDYANHLNFKQYTAEQIATQGPQVMQSYSPAQLPVLNQLAQAYAVSDAWYSSVPSQTNPNRAFLMCGTSLGLVNNGQLETNPQAQALENLLGMAIGDDQFQAPTIFNALDAANVSWGVFWQTSYLPEKLSTLLIYGQLLIVALGLASPFGLLLAAAMAALAPYAEYLMSLSNGELESCYTWRLFPEIQTIANAADNFQSLDQFIALAQAGQLPAFSYIEPLWTISQTTNPAPSISALPQALVTCLGNDYHPPCNLLAAEKLVKDVYQALISNQAAWQNTVLLITFDEPVGSFDHQAEGLEEGLVQPPWGTGTPPPLAQQNNFNFDRLGGRVPAIVVSPWVQQGTVFRSPTTTPFDHTTVIATALNLLGAGDQVANMGQRTVNAPTFDTVLTLTTPRTDAASLPFVDKTPQQGDPVNYGDSLWLANGPSRMFLSSSSVQFKATPLWLPSGAMGMCVDLGLAAIFPTLGPAGVDVAFISPAWIGAAGQIQDGDTVYLISRETSVGAANALGAWNDSYDCYYYTPDFDPDYTPYQTWTIHNQTSPGQPLTYGDQFTLMNQQFAQGLCQDGRLLQGGWISTSSSGDNWTILTPQVMPQARGAARTE